MVAMHRIIPAVQTLNMVRTVWMEVGLFIKRLVVVKGPALESQPLSITVTID
jgi:hypothetical protein